MPRGSYVSPSTTTLRPLRGRLSTSSGRIVRPSNSTDSPRVSCLNRGPGGSPIALAASGLKRPRRDSSTKAYPMQGTACLSGAALTLMPISASSQTSHSRPCSKGVRHAWSARCGRRCGMRAAASDEMRPTSSRTTMVPSLFPLRPSLLSPCACASSTSSVTITGIESRVYDVAIAALTNVASPLGPYRRSGVRLLCCSWHWIAERPQMSPGSPKMWSPCRCVTKMRSILLSLTDDDCISRSCEPSPQSTIHDLVGMLSA
mmetsp:Transcript_14815/g.46155  ORF Transcript_14815/g.46155 Transcript_14815/m.46155 type:complete len:260 (-) Transcript_14815:562-1341(-)